MKARIVGRLRTTGGYVLRLYEELADSYVVTDFSRRVRLEGQPEGMLPKRTIRKRGAR